MARMYIEIDPLIIQMDGPLSVGTGFRRGLIQRTVERDANGFVCIPASSLKGRIRHLCEQLARELGLHVCKAPYPGSMCSAHKDRCLVCRVFGAPGRASTLYWHDANLNRDFRPIFEKSNLDYQVYSRTQVQLSRALGTARPDHLFTSEFAIEGLCFESKVTGFLEATPINGDESAGGYELLLLLAGLRLVDRLGGGASRGAGWCTVKLPDEVKVDGNPISWQKVLNNLDKLPSFGKEGTDAD